MRFGISEISWTLPKILRIRRELVVSPLVVLRVASIALVAIVFPALRENAGAPPPIVPRRRPGSSNWAPAFAGAHEVERYPGPPLQFVRPVRLSGPVPERTGKAPG